MFVVGTVPNRNKLHEERHEKKHQAGRAHHFGIHESWIAGVIQSLYPSPDGLGMPALRLGRVGDYSDCCNSIGMIAETG